MFESAWSEEAYDRSRYNVEMNKNYDLAIKHGLALTELNALSSKREESFQSQLAERVPGMGKIVRMSGRAYAAYLNNLRMDVFSDLIDKAEAIGLDSRNNEHIADSISKFVNSASGRGDLGQFERAAVAFNTFFFSPRLMKSRMDMIGYVFNPKTYTTLNPVVRQEAFKSLLTVAGVGLTVTALASLGGAETEDDPRSADFGKIKIGNTRFDIFGGTLQYPRMAAQLLSGKIVSSTTGKFMVLGEKGKYRPLTRLDIAERFFENKEAPIVSFITNMLRGQNTIGEEFHVTNEFLNRMVPMVVQDMIEVGNDNPALLPSSLLAAFGVGMQTYKSEPKIVKDFNKKLSSLDQIYTEYRVLKKTSPRQASVYI